jgi:hypothetical protein
MVSTPADSGVRRTALLLLLPVAVETILIVAHFVYGAHTYDDDSRLHVVVPAIVSLCIAAALVGLTIWRPGLPTLGLTILGISIPYVAVFGLFHGAYSHLLKDVMFFHGASSETLESMFGSPDYAYPDNVVFELSGIASFVVSCAVVFRMVRLVKAVRLQSAAAKRTASVAAMSASAGATRLASDFSGEGTGRSASGDGRTFPRVQ